jgi:hypothetical protein
LTNNLPFSDGGDFTQCINREVLVFRKSNHLSYPGNMSGHYIITIRYKGKVDLKIVYPLLDHPGLIRGSITLGNASMPSAPC